MRLREITVADTSQLATEYPPVTEELLANIVQRVRASGSPLKIILFGSRCTTTAKPDSDIDILVIEESGCNCSQQQFLYAEAVDELFPHIDILVYTVDQIRQWRNVPNHLLSEALREGTVLYQDHSRLSWYGSALPYRDASFPSLLVSEPHTPYTLAKDWFEKADSALQSCALIISSGTKYDIACYLAQHAIEKYFKGFISLSGSSIPKSHDLDALRWQCRQINDLPGLSKLKLKTISSYAASARYDPAYWPSKQQAQKALKVAEEIRTIIMDNVPPETHPVQ